MDINAENIISIRLKVDGIRTDVERAACNFNAQVVNNNDSGTFIGSDEMSVFADVSTILMFLDWLYNKYGDSIEVSIHAIGEVLKMSARQMFCYIVGHHDVKYSQSCVHYLPREQWADVIKESNQTDVSLIVDNSLIFPKYQSNNIYFSRSCELTTLLLVLYNNPKVNIKKILLIYTLLGINIENKSSSNIYYLLKKMEKEISKLYKHCNKVGIIHLDILTYFQLKHELYHIKLRENPDLLNSILGDIKSIETLYQNIGNSRRKRVVQSCVTEALHSVKWQTELACDWYSILDTIKYMIASNYNLDAIKKSTIQILRMLTMTQYVKRITEASSFSFELPGLKGELNIQTFDTLRVANILNAILRSSLVDLYDKDIVDAFVFEINQFSHRGLKSTIKYGLFDLKLLGTVPDTSRSYEEIDEGLFSKLLEIFVYQRDLILSIISIRS